MADISLAAGAGTAAGFFFGIIGHEVATAKFAEANGDRSGRLTKRTSLHPRHHFDPLGTVILPIIFTLAALLQAGIRVPPFGWGKRHQINPQSFRNRKAGVWAVSLAGPGWTLLLAIIGGFGFRATRGACFQGIPFGGGSELAVMFGAFAEICVFLTVIELLPLPGRDGARILGLYLSPRAAYKIEELAEYDVLFVIGLMILLYPIAINLVAPVRDLVVGSFC